MSKSVPLVHPSAPVGSSLWHKIGPLVGFGSTLLVLGQLAYWGGVARPGPLFLVGIAVLTLLIATSGFVAWWLFLSPLPQADAVATIRSPELRQYVALMAVVSGLVMTTGSFWDELWHRTYGVSAALNDFLWRPHLMIYSSMAINSLFAVGALLIALRGGGDIRRRFRSEPLIGLLGLSSAYLALSGPSDLIWHRIYGLDVTGWSLPHLLLTGDFALVMLFTMAILLSFMPRQKWQGLRGLRIYELLSILLIAIAAIVVLVIMVTAWDGLTAIGANSANGRSRAVFWAWPEWLYPVVLLTNGIFIGSLAIHALRRAGAATLVMLTILGLRMLFFTAFGTWGNSRGMGFTSQVLLIPLALALDGWYALRLRRADSASTLIGGSLLAGAVFLAVALPAISQLLIYPRINATTVPQMIAFGLIMALWSGWVGARTGAWFGGLDRQVSETIPLRGRSAWIGVGTLAGLAAFTAFFILTATPPL